MARKPAVLLDMKVRPETRRLVIRTAHRCKIGRPVFVNMVMEFYGMLMAFDRSGGRIAAVSSDGDQLAPNLLITSIPGGRRRSSLTLRVPRTWRRRYRQIALWSGTDDVGSVFEKALVVYTTSVAMSSEDWTFVRYTRDQQARKVALFPDS